MNERVNTILSAGGKFTPGMHLTQPGLTYNASGPVEIYNDRIWRSLRRQKSYKDKVRIFCYKTLVEVLGHLTIQKISDARTIKNRWCMTKTNVIYAYKNKR